LGEILQHAVSVLHICTRESRQSIAISGGNTDGGRSPDNHIADGIGHFLRRLVFQITLFMRQHSLIKQGQF